MNLKSLAILAQSAHPEAELLKKADEISTEMAKVKNMEEELMGQIKTGQLKNDVATFLAVRDRLLQGEKIAKNLLADEVDSVGELESVASTGSGSSAYLNLINDMLYEFSRGG